ncbi:hypothetical protein [Bacillus horti]|uniref:Fluoroquinolone transport system permease protein n=1 Tax=Caldalkalibacillus horti TaxID=77523 RepID=A0ABT9VVP7_9BACI|nr:hypothetical protein [Bacillus horti]MDQ0165067.1 fluoroquinolone transport system permease protein [Bacillus horti]
MLKYKTLLISDIKNAARNPMFMLIGIGPLLLLLLIRYVLPVVADWLIVYTGFDLLSYNDFITILIMLVIPQLIGTATGLLMLDERDERIIDYYTVSPLGRHGYLIYRLLLPVTITILMSALFLLANGISKHQIENIAVLILLALQAPLYTLFLVAFAANKVEGLALSKLASLMLLGAIFPYFIPDPWQTLGIILPTYWPSRLYLNGALLGENLGITFFLYMIGLIFHMLLLTSLFLRYYRQQS